MPEIAEIREDIEYIAPEPEKPSEANIEPLEASEEPHYLASNEIFLPISCSCIKTARWEGVPIPPNTDAIDIKPSTPPTLGGLVIFHYEDTDVWHVATILKFSADTFDVVEGNYKRCEKTYRTIEWDDPSIVGYTFYE